MKVRINRAKWRGGLMEDSKGCSCVMGTIYKRLTHKKIGGPNNLKPYTYLEKRFGHNLVWKLIYANDDTWNHNFGYTEEKLIKQIKNAINIDVEFYGERNG